MAILTPAMPPNEHGRAMKRVVLLAACVALLSSTTPAAKFPSVIEWQRVTAPSGGDAEIVLPHRDVLLVRADSVWWASVDGGRSWRRMTGRLGMAWEITELGDDLFITDAAGTYRTSDVGRAWTSCGMTPHDPRRRGRLLATGRTLLYWVPEVALFRSHDRCATWTPVLAPWNTTPPYGVVLAPDLGVVLIQTQRGWFRTADEAQTWTTVSGPAARPLPSAYNGLPAIALGTDLVIGTTRGVFRSTNRGLSWTAIGFSGQPARTAVTRDGVIYAAISDEAPPVVRTTMMRSSDNGTTWVPADSGLSGHFVKDLGRDQAGAIYAASESGLYRLERSGRWASIGLPASFPTFLVAAPWGDLYLGTEWAALYRSQDRGASWRALLLPRGAAGSLATTRRGDLLVASGGQVFRSADRGDSWEHVEVHDDVHTILSARSTGVVIAGTTGGIFRSDDDGATWALSADYADELQPESLTANRNGDVFVGTATGDVYRLGALNEPWHPLPPMKDGSPASGLAALANGKVLVGTTFAFRRWQPGSDRWEDLPLSREEKPRVSSLVVGGDYVLAATAGTGVFISSDRGRTWTPTNRGLATRRVRRMALASDGEVYVATEPSGAESGAAAIGGMRIYRGRFVQH